jgi:hypothetical protein
MLKNFVSSLWSVTCITAWMMTVGSVIIFYELGLIAVDIAIRTFMPRKRIIKSNFS